MIRFRSIVSVVEIRSLVVDIIDLFQLISSGEIS